MAQFPTLPNKPNYPPSTETPQHLNGRVSIFFCFRNFSTTGQGNQPPAPANNYLLKLRKNPDGDCPNILAGDIGVALVDGQGRFYGWVKYEDRDVLRWRLQANHIVVAQHIQQGYEAGNWFPWEDGEGLCFSGRVIWFYMGKRDSLNYVADETDLFNEKEGVRDENVRGEEEQGGENREDLGGQDEEHVGDRVGEQIGEQVGDRAADHVVETVTEAVEEQT